MLEFSFAANRTRGAFCLDPLSFLKGGWEGFAVLAPDERVSAQRGRWLPGGNLLSLLRQRKKAKKGDPKIAALRVLCAAHKRGRLAKLVAWICVGAQVREANRHSDNASGRPPHLLRCSTAHMGAPSHDTAISAPAWLRTVEP
jgi:hypothetical protein